MTGRQVRSGCARKGHIKKALRKEVMQLMDGIFIEVIIGILRAVAEALGKGKD